MAIQGDLVAREAACKTVEDYIKLVSEALAEPSDIENAKNLLSKAEGICQMPVDYVLIAEVYALHLGDKDYAEGLYEEAEENCFDTMEFAAVGHSIAIAMGDKEKARELLENAAGSAKKPNELLAVASYAKSDLDDDALAEKLIQKVESQCKNLNDYKNLAEQLIKDGNKDAAKTLFLKAQNKIDGIEDTANFAAMVFELFDDKEAAISALEDVEDDAQFTKDCIFLAKSYNAAGDSDKAKEMMEKAGDFAMTGDENIQLALGLWELFKDKSAAASAFEKGLNDIADKNALLGFAATIAKELNNIELAKKFYAKAESKMTSAKDLCSLAAAAINDLKDESFALEIYKRAVAKISDPKELALIAADINKYTANTDFALEVYQKAFEGIEKFNGYIELLEDSFKNLGNKQFANEVLRKAEIIAQGTPELLKITKSVYTILEDKEFASANLLLAEENVTSLAEMKEVVSTVKEYFPDNADWTARVEDKLKKREANSMIYDEFQKRENNAKTLKEFMTLLDEMMAALDDKYYARKILIAAERLLDSELVNLDKYHKLIKSIKKYLGDTKWVEQIIDNLKQNRIQFHFELFGLIDIILKEIPAEAALNLSSDYLQQVEAEIDLKDDKTIYDYTDLANIAFATLGTPNWPLKLLEKAASLKCDVFALTYLGTLAEKWGDRSAGSIYYNQAVSACHNTSELFGVIYRLKNAGIDNNLIKELYAKGGSNLSSNDEMLIWAQGIMSLFNDKNWAEKEFKSLGNNFKTDFEKDELASAKLRSIENALA